MSNHSAARSRRVTRRHAVVGIAILAVSAVVLVTALSSHNAVSAAGSQAPAPTTGGSMTSVTSSALSATTPTALTTAAPATASVAPMAMLETNSSAAQPAAEQSAAEQSAAQPVAAPAAEPAPAPLESAPAPAPAASTEQQATTPSAEALVTGRTMYASEPVNVRNAPSTSGTSVLVTLDAREQVTAGDAVDGWIPVHAGAVYGWVKSGYLADGTAPEPAPAAVQEPAAAEAPAAESADNWMEALIPQVDPNGAANWVFRRNGGWGASDGHTNYIDPNVPSDKRYSVMVHELSHVLQVQVYGSLSKSAAAMSAITGSSSSDVSSNEKAADCMAIQLGASWINYGCPDSLRGAASAVLAGHRP